MLFTELLSEDEIRDLIEWHNENSRWVILDTETTGLGQFTDKITDVILSGKDPETASIFPGNFVYLLAELNVPIVCHNFKFDFKMCLRAGVDLRKVGLKADTMLLDHLLNENEPHGLDDIVQRRYQDNYKELFWGKYKTVQEAPRAEQIEYACKDVVYTELVYDALVKELQTAKIPQSLIDHVHQLALVLYNTEIVGIKLDIDYLQKISTDLSSRIQTLKQDMRQDADSYCSLIELTAWMVELDKRKTDKGKSNVKKPEFNWDSSSQLQKLLYDNLKLPVQLNKERKRTVDDAALESLESTHLLVRKLREYRGHQKVFTSFIEGSLSKMQGGRIYPSFNVNGTVTGRISSSNPNLQQLPTHGGVRGIYIPEPGFKFISADYKQLEVVIAAHYTKDPNLLKIVLEGASQHDITAKGLGIDRPTAKKINFALQYGAGEKKIKLILGCTDAQAQTAYNRYWETYPGLKTWRETIFEQLRQNKPLINLIGRKRHFPDWKTLDKWERLRIERQAPNFIIQGSGADITNAAVYITNNALINAKVGHVVLSVHDEIIISCPSQHAQQAAEILKECMIKVGKDAGLSIELGVDVSEPSERWQKG